MWKLSQSDVTNGKILVTSYAANGGPPQRQELFDENHKLHARQLLCPRTGLSRLEERWYNDGFTNGLAMRRTPDYCVTYTTKGEPLASWFYDRRTGRLQYYKHHFS